MRAFLIAVLVLNIKQNNKVVLGSQGKKLPL
ncbi:hypothetical protein M2407_002163 [Serratia sp. BIGb0234]|nr:hypothetical protein [Serratia sp. BIGb0234]